VDGDVLLLRAEIRKLSMRFNDLGSGAFSSITRGLGRMSKSRNAGKTRKTVPTARRTARGEELVRSVIEGLELRLLYTVVPAGTISVPTVWTAALSPYNLTGNVVVGAGASVTVQPGAVVTGSGLIVASGGTLTGTSANFSNPVWVQTGANASLNTDTFSNDVQFDTTAVTSAGNTFDAALTILPGYVPTLAGNSNILGSGATLDLEAATVSTPLTLPVISGIATYDLVGVLNVGSTGALTIASGVTVSGLALTIQTGGSITATTDTFDDAILAHAGSTGSITGSTLVSTIESDTGSLTLTTDTFESTLTILPTFAPTLASGGNTFPGAIPIGLAASTLTTTLTLPLITLDPAYNLAGGITVASGAALTITSGTNLIGSPLTIAAGGSITATDVSFNNQVLVHAGATGSMTADTFAGTLELDTAALTISTDTFSSVVTVLPTYLATLGGGGNTFTGSDIGLLGATLTAPLTIPVFTNVPAFDLVDTVYVGSGATLTILSGVTLTGSSLVVGSGATLTANAVIFDNSVDVQSGSTGNVSASTFAEVEFDATSMVIGTDTFTSTVTVLPTFVPSLVANGNLFTGNAPVNLEGSTLNSALTLPLITGVPNYSIQTGLFVGPAGSLNISAGVTVTGSTLTIESGGSLFANADTIAAPVVAMSGSTGSVNNSAFAGTTEFDVTSLTISGDVFEAQVSMFPSFAASLGVNDNTFPGSSGIDVLGSTITTSTEIPSITGVLAYDLVGNVNVGSAGQLIFDSGVVVIGSPVTVASGGSMLSVAATFYNPLTFNAGSTEILEYNTINAPMVIDGSIGATSQINHNNIFSDVTSQGTGGPINLASNWWGTTNDAVIDGRIEDANDNPTLPLVNYLPTLTSPVVIPTLLATISDPPVTTGDQQEVIAVAYTDATAQISSGSINSMNLVVTSAAGQVLTLTETGFTVAGNKTTVDYFVTPPNGSRWLPTDDGTGSVTISPTFPVSDVSGNIAFSPTIAFVVDVPGTTASATTTTASAATATVGASVSFTTTVTPATASSGAPAPTGVVSYVLNGDTLGSATLNSAGQAVFTIDVLPAGADSIITEYSGDNNYSASTSAAVVVNESVLLVSSTTTVSASVSTLTAGSPLTLTATVVPGVGGTATPTGTVNFTQNGTLIGSAALQPSGLATLSTTLAPGVYPIIATYSGDDSYATSASPALSITATSASFTTLTISPALLFANDPATLTATVLPSITGGVTLGGTVEFLVDSVTPLGSATINAAGQAVLNTTGIPVGANTLTAVYAGQGVYSGSTSQVLNQTVNPAPNSGVTVSVSAPSLLETGDPVTFNVTVASLIGGVVPTGQVTFSLGSTVLGAGTLQSNGTASFTTTALVVGTNTITINYGGDATYTPARPVSTSVFLYQNGPVPTSVTGTLPNVIAGTGSPGYINVTIANPGLNTLTGQGTINIFASLSGVVDANSVLVQSSYVTLKIKAGATEVFKVVIKPLPYNLPSGNYTLLAATSTPQGLFNYATAGPTLAVTAQSRSFSGAVTLLHVPATGTAISGNPTATTAQLSITNTGNVGLQGKTTFLITASTTSGVVGTQAITYNLNQRIAPGKSAKLNLPLKSFPIVATGNYFVVVQMTDPQSDTFVFSSTQAVPIAARVVTLSASFAAGSFLEPAGLFITITNNGNAEDISTFTAVASYSLDAAGTQPLLDRTATVNLPKLKLLPGRSVKVRINAWSTLSPNIAVGTPYYATITLTDASGNTTTAVDPEFQVAVG
jgi:hypothetical protein